MPLSQPRIKRCTMCRQEYPWTLDYFHSNAGRLRSRCRECSNAVDRGDLIPIHHIRGNTSQQLQCLICQQIYPSTTEYFRRMGRGDEKLRKWCKNCEKAIYRGTLVVVDVYKCAEGMRRCSKCLRCKPATNVYFDHRNQSSDGLRAECKECRKLDHRLNGERTRQRVRDWNNQNSKTHVDKVTQWRKANPEKYIVQKQRRRARKLDLPDTLTVAEWQGALDYFDRKCAVCGKDLKKNSVPAADHWIPLSKGGATTAGNIIPLCHGSHSCNNYKQASMPEIWLKRMLGEEKAQEKLAEIDAYFEWVRQQNRI